MSVYNTNMKNKTLAEKNTLWINTIPDITDEPKQWIALPAYKINIGHWVQVFNSKGELVWINTEIKS